MKKFLEKNRILPPLFFLISGIILSDFVKDQWLIIVIISPILGIVSLSDSHYFKGSLLLPIGLLFISYNTVDENKIVGFKDIKLDVEGIIYKSLERTSSYTKILLNVEKVIIDNKSIPSNGRIIIYAENNFYGLYRGYRIRVLNTKLHEFKVYKNPGNFDIRKYYYRKGIYLKGYIKNDSNLISFGRSEKTNTLLINIDKLRENFGVYIRQKITFPSSEIFTALTTGEKKGIPPEIREELSSLGIAHLVAISGLHVGAIALIFYFLINWFLKRSEYLLLNYNVPKLTAILSILPILIYMIVAGLATPVLRATIMVAIYLLSIIIGRPHNKLNTLGVAAFIILILDPSAIYDLSFQLSFISVAGILIVNYLYPYSFSSFKAKVLTSLKCTTAATIFTAPLIINSFGILPLISIPANLVFIPIVEFIIIPICLLSFIAFNIHEYISDLLILLNGNFIELFLYSVNYLSELSFSSFTIPYINKISFVFLYITILLLIFSNVKRKLIYLATTSLVIFIITVSYDNRKSHHLEILFPDAGRRICSLIKLSNGKTILINGNSGFHYQDGYIERSVISNYLLNSGISKIDYMILLSNEQDLLEGSMFLITKFKVDFLFTKGDKLTSDIWENIYNGDLQKVDLLAEAEPLIIDNIKLKFYIRRVKEHNGNKIIMNIVNKNYSILLGSISSEDIYDNQTMNNYVKIKGADVIYIPDIIKSDAIINLLYTLNPSYLITREISNKIKLKLLSLFPDISIYETKKQGLTSITINQNIEVITAYR